MRYPIAAEAFDRLLCIMDDLREKCPWDKKQSLETLRHLTIEETYELSDAILSKDMAEIRKEVGDVMLHLVFYSKIGSETGDFDATSVLNGICEKLISRHPHIYGDVVAETEEQVKANWEALKLKEGNESVLSGVPGSLPSLIKAMRIQEKARGAGFDWEEKEQVWEKVEEELAEFKETFVGKELTSTQKEEAEGELGDLIFSLVNFARFIDINPDQAVERTNRKFIYRFQHLERRAAEMCKNLQDMTLAEMDVLWNEAKVTLPGSSTPAASTGEREK